MDVVRAVFLMLMPRPSQWCCAVLSCTKQHVQCLQDAPAVAVVDRLAAWIVMQLSEMPPPLFRSCRTGRGMPIGSMVIHQNAMLRPIGASRAEFLNGI
eukprot:1158952-Pelagomonas_calceolata.AAC.3